jgi:drug/metabolite transporter (DMT)-like permease
MSLTAIVLLSISAVTHAGWNLLSKRYSSSPSFFLVANIVGFVALFPFLVFHRNELLQFPAEAWVLLVITGFFLALNYWALASAYKSGDMSIVYPLARSSPIIVVSIVTLVLGQADQLSIQCMLGIPLVVGGCFLIPMRRFADIRFRNYFNTACIFAFVAALGTAGYSMVDDNALRLLRNTLGGNTDTTVSITLIYAGLQALSSSLWLALLVGARRVERVRFRQILLTGKGTATIAGIGIFGTYALVLISMAFVTNVSYVVAFRQLSIPIGTCFGIFILGESYNRPKIIGVCIIFLGLMLVGSG